MESHPHVLPRGWDDCHAFRGELQATYPTRGHALWEPDPGGLYNAVEVGDVGFIRDGYFYRLFNALLSKEHDHNQLLHLVPQCPPQLIPKIPNHIRKNRDNQRDFCSKDVARAPRNPTITNTELSFTCSGKHGALMSLPFGAQREDTIAHGDFSNWIVKNVHHCIKIAEDYGSGIERMEDIILVTGRHLAKSWIYATFPESPENITITVQVRVPKTSAIHLREWNVNGGHLKLGPSGEDLPENQCVFVRGYRVVCAQDPTSGLQGVDLQAVTVGGPSDPETILTTRIPLPRRPMTGQASPAPEKTFSTESLHAGDEEGPDASMVVGHKPLPTSPAQQGLTPLVPSPSFAGTRAGLALSINDAPSIRNAYIFDSKWHEQQRNYLRTRQKHIGAQLEGQDRDPLNTDDDVSCLDNEECEDDSVESDNDNGPCSPDTMSKRSFSTQCTVSTVSSKLSKMLS
ncbi:hypothetical protein BC826DRAFT_1042527 [Russula brevipes]|nr:hypothetical protein BC826DRAFT_1042527 [Russula brevipes]